MKQLQRFLCLIGDHEWTSKVAQGIKPTEAELEAGIAGFAEYAKMYCGACGHESEMNKRLLTGGY